MARGKISTDLVGTAPATIQPTVRPGPAPFQPPALRNSTAIGLERLANQLIPALDKTLGVVAVAAKNKGSILAEQNAAKTTQEILEEANVPWGLNDFTAIGINQTKGANMGREFMQEWSSTVLPGMIDENSTISDIMSKADDAMAEYTKTFNLEKEDGATRLLERNRKAMSDAAFEEYGKMRVNMGNATANYIQGARTSAFDIETARTVRSVLEDGGGETQLKELLNDSSDGSLLNQAANWGIPRATVREAAVSTLVNMLNAEEVPQNILWDLSGIAVDISLGADVAWLVEDPADSARLMTAYRAAEGRDLVRAGTVEARREVIRKNQVLGWYAAVPDIADADDQQAVNAHIAQGMKLRVENPGGKIKQYRDSTGNLLTPDQHAELRFDMLNKGGFNIALSGRNLSYSDKLLMFGYEKERADLIRQVTRNPTFKHHLAKFADAIGGELMTMQDGSIVFVSTTVRDPATEKAKRRLFTRVVRESMTHVSTPRTAAGVDADAAKKFDAALDKVFNMNEAAYKEFLESTGATRKNLLNGFLHSHSGAQAPPNVGAPSSGAGDGGFR